jgi:hypothetical protein
LLWCGEGTELARAWRRWLRDQAGNQPAPPEPECDYPRTNSGPLCHASESGYLDSTDVYCPFSQDGQCTSGCPTNRERACILGEDEEF